MRTPQHAGSSRGFSLIEVMVALVVISVGLLGLAKMQALSLSSTNVARLRSLAAIEAASLASAMHANRAYWAVNYPVITTAGTAITSSDAALVGATDCSLLGGAAPCSATQLAASDLNEWVTNFAGLFPAGNSAITCTAVTTPLSCIIQIGWVENVVSRTQQSTASAGVLQTQTYILNVQP
jgi:type IV pilus assembly protein PilV